MKTLLTILLVLILAAEAIVWFQMRKLINSWEKEVEKEDMPLTDEEVQYVKPGTTFQLGGATIEVLGPVKDNYEDINDLSLVLMVTYGNIKKPMGLRQLGNILSNKGYTSHRATVDGIRQRGWVVYERTVDELQSLKNRLKE